MKKLMFLMMAFAAILLTSCTHETCTLSVVNYNSNNVIVYFSADQNCSSATEAEYVAEVPAGKAVQQKKVKVDNLYAIIFIQVENSTAYQRKGVLDLREFAGMAYVTVTVKADGLYGVSGESL